MSSPGRASLLWMHHALQSMDADLRARYGTGAGIAFLNRKNSRSVNDVDGSNSSMGRTLKSLVQELGVGWVVASRRHEPALAAEDVRCETTLRSVGVKVWYICIVFFLYSLIFVS